MSNNLRILFKVIDDGILITDPEDDNIIVDANPEVCELLGYKREEINGLKREDLFVDPPTFSQTMKPGKSRQVARHKSGRLIEVETTAKDVQLEDLGKMCCTIVRPISEDSKAFHSTGDYNRLLDLQNEIAKIFNEKGTFEELLSKCMNRINSYFNLDIGHLFIRKSDNAKSVYESCLLEKNTAGPGYDEFVQASRSTSFNLGEGFVGKTALEKRPFWVQKPDLSQDYLRAEPLMASGIQLGLMVPVIVDEETEAVIEFYSSEQQMIDDTTEHILESLGKQIGFMLERKRRVEQLSDEKENYRLLAENSTDVITRQAPDGTYLYVSPACKAIMGYNPDELVGTSAYSYCHPDDIDRLSELRQKVSDTDDTLVIDYRIREKEGGWTWVESANRALRTSESDEVTEIQTVMRDITIRKEYEKRLKSQVHLNEKIIDSMPGIFFIISSSGVVERVNDELRELTGYNPDIEKKMFYEFVDPDDELLALDSFREAFDFGLTDLELRIKGIDGESVPYVISALVDELNEERYLIGTGINIEERKKIEKQLVSEKQFTDHALNSLPGLFYVLDENQNFVRVNDNFVKALGYTRDELDEMEPLDFYLEEDQQRMLKAVERAFQEGSATLTSRIKTKDGHLPCYELTGTFFRDKGKNYILGTGIDITEQRRLETLLQQAHSLARIGAWEVDLLNDKVTWSQVTKEIHEVNADFEPDLNLGINFYKPGKSRKAILNAIEQLIESGTPFDVELQIITAKGNERWIRAIGKAERVNGKCIRMYGSFQDIHEKKVIEEQIRESLKEKEILLSEVHHRVKNNLALVSGFLQLQAFRTEHDYTQKVLLDSQSRIKSIALIHEDLYQYSSYTKIDAKKNAAKLIDHLGYFSGQYEKIDVQLTGDEVLLNINQAVPFAIVINELVTNCYKHAFSETDEGHIRVDIRRQDKKVLLEITDNGRGLPENFSMDDEESLGMTLVKALVTQLDGEFCYQRNEIGTSFFLSFDISESVKGSSSNI
ncbi:PAS domain S-box protein [Rhodohalobacter mucosus]|nr:PAS domain S-box protein [Rhodohalobacter mucosus]